MTLMTNLGRTVLATAALALLTLPLFAQRELTVHPFFGSHMVIPRDTTIRLRGSAPPRTVIKVRASWLDETYQGMANDQRGWEVSLPTPPAGGPHRLEIRGGDERIDLDHLAAGDVWIASGQSNMEWLLRDTKPDLAKAQALEGERDATEELSLVRYLDVARNAASRPQGSFRGAWRDVDVKLLPKVSAVGYFFAREIADRTGIPIGIISSNWGGTPAHAWTSAATLRELGILTERLDAIDRENADFDDSEKGWTERLRAWRKEVQAKDAGFADGWWNRNHDDSAWKTRANLSTWTEAELANYDGSVWFRSTFQAKSVRGDAAIEFGPIDDQDDVYINGIRVGGREEGSGWNKPRRYAINPGVIRRGENTIVVRVTDTGGAGGVSGSPDLNRVLVGKTIIPLTKPWRWQKGTAMSDFPAPPRRQVCGPHDPASLFRGMIRPFRVFPIRGAIWYQGESDVSRAEQYATLFPAMIRDWRRLLANDDLSFYFVQIAPFGYRQGLQSAALRQAQEAALALPKTGMATTLDLGNARDIHPRQKAEVGSRLAAFALARDYGVKGLRPDTPGFAGVERESDTLVVRFRHVETGLASQGPLVGFEVSADGETFREAPARIVGQTVVIRPAGGVSDLRFVRYAWANVPQAPLRNGEGLPVSSFLRRID